MTPRSSVPPRICFLTGTLNAMGGAERMTATIANGLAERGYEVRILSLWDHGSCFALHAAVRHDALYTQRPSFKRAYLATVSAIRRHVRRHRIDTLVLVDTMLTLFTVPALLGLGVRQIAWEHCHFDEDLGRRSRQYARRLAAHACSGIVVLTERDRRRWLEALQPRSEVACIPNPLPFPMPAQASARDKRTVLAVGRLVPAKGFDVLLQAWHEVAPAAPEWKLTIVGEGDDRAQLEALRDQLGLADCVSLPGATQDMASVYAKASIFCLSSRYEGFGLVLIEAMAHGLPIVSSDCETGPRELLRPREDALVVPVDDATALATSILQLIAAPELARQLGEAARTRARDFTAERILPQWDELLT